MELFVIVFIVHLLYIRVIYQEYFPEKSHPDISKKKAGEGRNPSC
jgi:hypothetical protein